MHEEYNGRAGIAQRLLQPYRINVYDMIASHCRGGLSVFASRVDANNQLLPGDNLRIAKFSPAHNRYFFRGKFDLCWQAGIFDWLRSEKPDVVVLEANPRNLSTSLMIRWLHNHGCRVIGHGLGVMPLTSGFEIIRQAGRQRLMQALDGILAYGSLAAEQYHSLGMPKDRIFVAYNAVSPKPIGQPPCRPSKFMQRPIILFVGGLIIRKSIDLLMKACARLPDEPRPLLRIVGDGPLRNELHNLSATLNLQVEFLGDLRGARLSQEFDKADLFVLPGTGGLAIQEAMAHALPVIVSKADGTEIDLARNENGWIIPPGDHEILSDTIKQALSNPARLREMGSASYDIVSREINIENMSKTFIQAMITTTDMPLRRET
jgi:glycosyltransferase involved in cell wall biosynthesis